MSLQSFHTLMSSKKYLSKGKTVLKEKAKEDVNVEVEEGIDDENVENCLGGM